MSNSISRLIRTNCLIGNQTMRVGYCELFKRDGKVIAEYIESGELCETEEMIELLSEINDISSGYWQVISATKIANKEMVVYSTPDDNISIQYDGIEVRRIVNPEYDYQDIIDKVIEEYKAYYENEEKSRKVSATFTRKVNYVMAMAAIQYLEPQAQYSTTDNDLEIIVEVREKNLIEVVNAIGSCNPIKY